MGVIQLGNVELGEAAYRALAERAKAKGHSVEAEVADILTRQIEAQVRSGPKGRWLELARDISAMTPKGVVQSDGVGLLRGIRDECDM